MNTLPLPLKREELARSVAFVARCALAAAIAYKLAALMNLSMPVWASISALVIAQEKWRETQTSLYERIRGTLPDVKMGPKGESVVLPTELSPGETCRLEFRGCSWSAVNGGRSVIAAGERARIDRVEGLTLVVHADSHAS